MQGALSSRLRRSRRRRGAAALRAAAEAALRAGEGEGVREPGGTEGGCHCWPSIRGLDCSCFDGKYVTEHVGAAYLQSLAQERKANRGDSDTNACHLLYKLDPAPAGAERAR